ncbi:hypothetical protein [Nonomuraea solani]|nr:hypothetical protein [Nonomuraea solani]
MSRVALQADDVEPVPYDALAVRQHLGRVQGGCDHLTSSRGFTTG